ncbi:MAG: DivIVA domain-containing protein [Oscillospiraceae bacterium]|nr:DivIVA domain-containing protein [Oscillospiraceae bacterium]
MTMITANDINMKRFEQARPGYKTEEVDELLKQVADQLTVMEKERDDSEKKIEVLVESVRRYKADEEALKDAMIGAQKQGRAVISEAKERAEQIIAEAQNKAEQIISAANIKADEIAGSASVRARREQEHLERMQTAVKEFKSDLLAMYKSHLELITALPEDDDEEEEASEQQVQPEQPVQPEMQPSMGDTIVMEPFDDTRIIEPSV